MIGPKLHLESSQRFAETACGSTRTEIETSNALNGGKYLRRFALSCEGKHSHAAC